MLWLQLLPMQPIPPGSDVVLEAMKQRQLPLTRAQYLMTAGLVEPLGAEVESMLPREFRLNPGELF